ncbi:MAG: Bug family tripartite tricarboxylate transporter substrate binding protein [Burkholderiaceae bacterium]
MTELRHKRRDMLRLGFAATCLATLADAQAQAYPSRTISVISPFTPGGADALMRLLLPGLQQRLGRSVIIENVAGAGGLIGAERAARAAPDGYTLLFAPSSASVTSPLLYRQPNIDALRDFTPIIATHEVPQVLVVYPGLGVASVADLIALARARPGEIAFGTSGHGTAVHLNGELFSSAANVKLLHVPFRGSGPLTTEILAGRVPITFTTIPLAHGLIVSGKLRALAVLDSKPSPFLPGVPPITDTLPSFRPSDTWACILAPARTPAHVQEVLFQAFRDVLDTTEVRTQFRDNFAYVLGLTPQQTSERLTAGIEQTRTLMKVAGIEQL